MTTLQTQAGRFTTTKMVNIDFCLPEFSDKTIVAWKFHVDNPTEIRYDMIPGIYLLTVEERLF